MSDTPKQNGEATPVIVRLSDVTPRPMRWLWKPRIAIGKITLLAGDPGLGKSTVATDLAARISTGSSWPDGQVIEQPGGVVIISAEDDIEDTIRPRLDAAGADVSRITAVPAVEYKEKGKGHKRAFSLADLPALTSAIEQTANCRLVILDPISAYTGKIDSHKNAEVRTLLAPISDIAQQMGVAVLMVSHLNKSGDARAIYRITGSLAFTAAARAVWAVIEDPTDEKRRRRFFLPVKNNLGDDRQGLCYEIRSTHDDMPIVVWDSTPIDISANQALAPEKKDKGPKPEKLEEAKNFLLAALAEEDRLSEELFEEAKEQHNISRSTLFNAKKALGIVARKEKRKDGRFWWNRIDQSRPQTQQPHQLHQLHQTHPLIEGDLSNGNMRRMEVVEVVDVPQVVGDGADVEGVCPDIPPPSREFIPSSVTERQNPESVEENRGCVTDDDINARFQLAADDDSDWHQPALTECSRCLDSLNADGTCPTCATW